MRRRKNPADYLWRAPHRVFAGRNVTSTWRHCSGGFAATAAMLLCDRAAMPPRGAGGDDQAEILSLATSNVY